MCPLWKREAIHLRSNVLLGIVCHKFCCSVSVPFSYEQRNNTHFTKKVNIWLRIDQGHGKGQGQVGKLKNSEKQIYITLLLITFGFLVLSTPSYVFNSSQLIYNYNNSYSGFHLFLQVARNVHYTNCGVNFFLYVMSGHKFRNDLLRLFKFKRDKSNTDSTTNISMMSASVAD